ncbi:MAG TPA: Holliday junction branch migration DNA helicase RuvB [Caldisericia bacterium]|nr:Holliday junction branch migration DNA helicase RuvB [Caldisericia bacterium]HOW03107.1 Holliday junction branch migration DNA helicase RuvB [Caldisericia bacterium]HQG82330.1 Holliday junction branch migration DNA helicase RuvB [Caldisericia bacterium]HXK69803.1 Holliday junction branch migration DNA helicase RuvB [Caldisericia bacterium]
MSEQKNQNNNELKEDNTLRPSNLTEYVGQEAIKENLKIAMLAARSRGDCLEHILLYGPPGLGKTSLANVIANEMKTNLIKTTATSLKRVIDLFSLVVTLDEGDILFIDEIHRLDKRVEEAFYSVMEDFQINIIRGSGRNIKAVSIPVNKFSLVGATTKAGLLSKPLRDRFGLVFSLNFYSPQELIKIVLNAAAFLEVEINEKEALEIAIRSRGTPRIAINLIKRARDYASVYKSGKIDSSTIQNTFESLRIDELGLGEEDRKLLLLLKSKNGKPLGLTTIQAILNEDKTTIEEMIEPYLLSLGFIEKTPKGRILTSKGFKYLIEKGYQEEGNNLF